MRVAVIDAGTSNMRSLVAALAYLGVHPVVTSDAGDLATATHVILPGVGAYDAAMTTLHAQGLVQPLRTYALEWGRPLLGVCLGMQLLFDGSDEGSHAGLGVLSGRLQRMVPDGATGRKVPHVGFAPVYGFRETGLFAGLGTTAHFYFTHSYALPAAESTANVARCDHGRPFVAALQDGRICGAQFHPEKSQSSGLRLMSNFLDQV